VPINSRTVSWFIIPRGSSHEWSNTLYEDYHVTRHGGMVRIVAQFPPCMQETSNTASPRKAATIPVRSACMNTIPLFDSKQIQSLPLSPQPFGVWPTPVVHRRCSLLRITSRLLQHASTVNCQVGSPSCCLSPRLPLKISHGLNNLSLS
jgi:hypothetical protein